MAISIFSNASSLRAQRALTDAQGQLSSVFERLSSGSRINRASDDAASLAIATSLQSDVRTASAAIRNANDGISLISIADGALGQLTSVLTRMSELAEQSANGVYSNNQRSALANEFIALGSEIERIATTTSFNGINLLSGSQSLNLQVGFTGAVSSLILVSQAQGTLSALQLAGSGSSALMYSVNGSTVLEAQGAAKTALQAVTDAIQYVTAQRGSMGAAESRLNTALQVLASTRENYAAAQSRIQDTDVAADAAQLVRTQILSQAGVAVLAQANQQPALAISLLR